MTAEKTLAILGFCLTYITLNVKSSTICPDVLQPGDQVTRGRDWKWGNQDNMVQGTVAAEVAQGIVEVHWSSGNFNFYRYDLERGIFDLQKLSDDHKVQKKLELHPMPRIGDRVIRYKDWKWGDEGSGTSGTVLAEADAYSLVHVRWDDGMDDEYRFDNATGIFDVRVASPAEVGEARRLSLHTPCCNLSIGDRVQPGKDCEDEKVHQDTVGIIVDNSEVGGWLRVTWENNYSSSYRCGYNGKFDLKLANSQAHDFQAGDRIKMRTTSMTSEQLHDDRTMNLQNVFHYGTIVETIDYFGIIQWDDNHFSVDRLDKPVVGYERAEIDKKSNIDRPNVTGIIDKDLEFCLRPSEESSEEDDITLTVIVSFDGAPIPKIVEGYSNICNTVCRLNDFKVLPALLHRNADLFQQPVLQMLKARKVEHSQLWIVNKLVVYEANWALVQDIVRTKYVAEVKADKATVRMFQPSHSHHPVTYLPQWNIKNLNADQAQLRSRGTNIKVGVIDTGVYDSHATLSGKMIHWYDALPPQHASPAPIDQDGHGTHITAIIVGDLGVGVAPDATFLACRNMQYRTGGYQSANLFCLQFMYCPNPGCTQRPRVINNSWGDYSHDDYLSVAIQVLNAQGTISVFAVGNAGPNCGTLAYPASKLADSLVTVGAIAANNSVAWFSNRGPSPHPNSIAPDIVAPGVQIVSAHNTGHMSHNTEDGTSFAAPHVTGTIALWLAVDPTMDVKRVKDGISQSGRKINSALRQTCGNIDDSVYPNPVSGYGRLDALGYWVLPPDTTT